MNGLRLFTIFLIVSLSLPVNGTANIRTSHTEQSKAPSYFEQAARSRYFVDKTAILKVFTDRNFHFITCPPGFGTSTNLDMIKRFYQLPYSKKTGDEVFKMVTSSYKLFTNTSLNMKIAQDQKYLHEHFGQYIVLHIDFGNVRGNTLEEVLHSMKEKISQTIAPYRWLYEKLNKLTNNNNILQLWHTISNTSSKEFDFVRAYKYVAGSIAENFGKKIIIIIANYDIPYQRCLGGELWAINEFFRSLIFSFMFTNKEPVEEGNTKVIITGVFRSFLQAALDEKLFRVAYAPFLSYEYGVKYKFYFTEDEVNRLLALDNIDETEKQKVKKYFNGYVWKEKVNNRWHTEERAFVSEELVGESFYNPSGVIRYLETKTLQIQDTIDNIMIPKVMKCIRYPTMFNEIMTLLTKRTTRDLLPTQLSHKINILNFLHNMAENDCSKSVLYRFEVWFGGHPHLIPFLDSGYFTHKDGSFAIANIAMKNKLNQELKRFMREMYGINITRTDITDYVKTITTQNLTSNEMLTNLTTSLQDLTTQMVPFGDGRIFKFQSLMVSAFYYNWDSYDDTVKIASISDPCQEASAHNGWLPIPNIKQGILLNIEIEARKDDKEAVCQNFRKYVPLDPPDKSVIKLVKYICIYIDVRNRIHVQRGENRNTW